MAKDLPYFKFFTSEWLDGDISLESYELQGLFISICSYYWSNECQVEYSKLLKKFKGVEQQIDSLLQSNIIKLIDNNLSISFLNEQRDERKSRSDKSKEAVNKRWEEEKKRKEENLYENDTTVSNPYNETNTDVEVKYYESDTKRREEKREEEKKEEKILVSNEPKQKKSLEERKLEFQESIRPYLEEFTKDTCNDFVRHWTEPTKDGKKMLFELQKTWSTKGRLVTWKKNEYKFFKK